MIQQVFFIAVAALFSRSGAVAAPTPKAAAVVDCVKNLQKHLKSDGQGRTLNMNGKFAKPIYGKTRCRGGLEQSKSSFDKGENSFGFIVSANIKSGAAPKKIGGSSSGDLKVVSCQEGRQSTYVLEPIWPQDRVFPLAVQISQGGKLTSMKSTGWGGEEFECRDTP